MNFLHRQPLLPRLGGCSEDPFVWRRIAYAQARRAARAHRLRGGIPFLREACRLVGILLFVFTLGAIAAFLLAGCLAPHLARLL